MRWHCGTFRTPWSLGKNLDGDRAVEAGVAGLVDLAHTPGADRAEGFVGAEPRASGECHAASGGGK